MAKIKKITVSNLKAVSALTADFNGCTAIITGGNNRGKSSFLRSLPDRLRGNKPDMILKQGEKEGSAEWELTSGEKFLWTFNGKTEKLTFISERNIKSSLTKDISTFYFPPVFDVDAFLAASPKKQKEILQKISGIDFTELDGQYKEAYESRTWANKALVEAKAKLIPFDKHLDMTETRVEDLAQELSGIEAHNMRNKQVVDGIAAKKLQIETNTTDIDELLKKIKMLKDSNTGLQAQVDSGNVWLEDPKNAVKTNAAELKEKIAQARNNNDAIVANAAAKRSEVAVDQAQKAADEADAEVKRLENAKAEAIRCANLPEGFGFDDEGITYNGLPFTREQLSSSAIYIAALKLAAIGLGEVKALHFDASFLDKNSLAEIEAWAVTNDLQLLIERPDYDAGEIKYELILATPIAQGVLVEAAA